MARKLRVGMVGLGRIFDLNVRGYLNHPEAEIAALCEMDGALLARRASEHPGAFATSDFQSFLRAGLDLIEISDAAPVARDDGDGGARQRRACQCAKADGDGLVGVRPDDCGRRCQRKAFEGVRELFVLSPAGPRARVASGRGHRQAASFSDESGHG